MFDPQITALFSIGAFRRMANNEPVSLLQLNLITDALTSANVPYDVSFDPATRKTAPALQLPVHVNPGATLVFVVSLTPGSNAFAPSP